jgi:proline dehydrogenase
MGLARSLFLAASQSTWLKERACRWRFVKRSVSKFMPGETLAEALNAARELNKDGITTILTCLGENVTTWAEAEAVERHYEAALGLIADAALDAQISVKLTQLGLDLGMDRCVASVLRLVERAGSHSIVWIDMESSAYTDRTLAVYRKARERAPNVGVAVQAYLHRTERDLEELIPLAPAVRLVKGAYREPASVAFPNKKDVDENYFRLATRFLAEATRQPGAFLGVATHDGALIERILEDPALPAAPKDSWEIEMLYGIRSAEQRRLVEAGRRVRVLISYGSSWFPWYMRRLAERPANVGFVVRNLFRK